LAEHAAENRGVGSSILPLATPRRAAPIGHGRSVSPATPPRYGVSMTDPDVLREPPVAGDETATYIGSLERQRRTLAWKSGGLDAVGLRTRIAASTITLGGLLKHLALVEADYLVRRLHGRDPGPPWNTVDWDADPDWEWRTAADDTPEELTALWEHAIGRSRTAIAEALAEGGLDYRAKGIADEHGEAPTLRRILIDLIEEYARHNGHADLIRESVDGLVGEDPPD
jgi:uncharacterized protein DUF664